MLGNLADLLLYANEGIGLVLFFESDNDCTTSYEDRSGKYQGHRIDVFTTALDGSQLSPRHANPLVIASEAMDRQGVSDKAAGGNTLRTVVLSPRIQ